LVDAPELTASAASRPHRGPGDPAFPEGGVPGWRFKILALVIGIVLSFIVAEVILRQVLPAPTRFYVWPPNLRMGFRPSPDAIPGIVGPSRFAVHSLGFRGREPSRDASHEYRVLISSWREYDRVPLPG